MTANPGRRGQPLAVLALLLVGWVVIRTGMWESPFPAQTDQSALVAAPRQIPTPTMQQQAQTVSPLPAIGDFIIGSTRHRRRMLSFPASSTPQASREHGNGMAGLPPLVAPRAMAPIGADRARAGFEARAPIEAVQPGQQQSVVPAEVSARKRWRFDAWLHWREGSGVLAGSAAVRPATYGASQVGGVLRYRLGDDTQPFLFARATKALAETEEADLALGAGVRPVGKLPIVLFGEARMTTVDGNWSLRPAAYAVTEIPPIKVTEKIEAEAYVQAGYVGGDFATPFADGQVKVDRRMAGIEGVELRAGAGAWGGFQEGAERIDIGPTASARFSIGKVPVRLSADYRVRVAGGAEPGSGVAVTLSSGF